MMNIFPVKILFKKTQKRNVLKWIEHVLALKADKYGGSIQKPVRQALRRILFKKKSKSDISRCLYTFVYILKLFITEMFNYIKQ